MDVDSDADEDEELSLVDVRARVLRAGFTETQLQETLDSVSAIVFRVVLLLIAFPQYERMDVLMIVAHGSKIRLISAPA
jgi:DNA replication licensing factor MCM7